MRPSQEQGGALTRLETGLDWYSATLPAGHSQSGSTYDAAMAFLEHQQAEGNTAKETTLLGYRGVLCGKCFIGEREDGILVRSTSAVSTAYYEATYTPDMHVSRLDLQCTVWLTGSTVHFGRIAREAAARHRIEHPKEAKRKISAWDNEDGGYTLYIGSKASAHFCRLYDKGAESEEEYYQGAWRYEVETHNDTATASARYILEHSAQLEAVVAATVRQYYQSRGVTVPWYVTDEYNALRPLLMLESDDARSLKWLAAQVAPTVKRLQARGYLVSVLEALGLEQNS